MDLPQISLAGTPKAMGEAFGEQCRDDALALYEIRLKCALGYTKDNGRPMQKEDVLRIARSCIAPTEQYDPVGYQEFLGIGRGAGLTPEQTFVLHGLTDLRDLLAFGPAEGCSSFIVAPDHSATNQLLLGQTWDLQSDNMEFVRMVHRQPTDGPETWSLTLTGCLTLIGLNEPGIAVGNTNLKTTDARVGVQYLSVLHRALNSPTFEAATQAIREAPRAGAHYYYVGDKSGRATGLECSATRVAPFEVNNGTFTHCNHALNAEIAALEVEAGPTSTTYRQNRLTQLLKEAKDSISVEALKTMLSDHEGGPDRCLCRHDHEDTSTNATVIISPSTGELHACRGQAHVGEWITVGNG